MVLRACSWSYFLHSFFRRSSKLNNQSAPLGPAFTVRCEPFTFSWVNLVTYPLLTDLDISWNHYFGGSNGKLSYKGNNLTEDKTLAAGTYKMTVNLIKGTYSITK